MYPRIPEFLIVASSCANPASNDGSVLVHSVGSRHGHVHPVRGDAARPQSCLDPRARHPRSPIRSSRPTVTWTFPAPLDRLRQKPPQPGMLRTALPPAMPVQRPLERCRLEGQGA